MSPASGQLRVLSRRLIGVILLPLAALLLIAAPARASGSAALPQASTAKARTSTNAAASSSKQKPFSSPQEACSALYEAARNKDEDGILVILGPDARDAIIWTDNPADRKADMGTFAQKYQQMHRLVKEPDGETTLYVGAENWPLPFPLIERNGAWHFDASLGAREILYRRIGENETNAMDVLRALGEAENEFYDNAVSGSPVEYAPRFGSDQGKRDGLYWQGSGKDETSLIGKYLAEADYDRSGHKPLHGYYFRILMQQGPNAPGGARKYLVNGKMTGGYAFVAFPAEYRSSGVNTFLVGDNGAVYQRDLGPNTTKIASTMTDFDPGPGWTRVP